MFSILDTIGIREAFDPAEKLTDRELFRSFVSQNIKIHSSNKADKAVRDFAASIASAYRLSARRTTILDQKYKIAALDHLLKHKRKLRKLWQENRDPACEAAVTLSSRNIRRMVWKGEVERWETKLANCEVTHQAIWPIVKSLTKSSRPKALRICNSSDHRPHTLSN
jgi:hypothetical protein